MCLRRSQPRNAYSPKAMTLSGIVTLSIAVLLNHYSPIFWTPSGITTFFCLLMSRRNVLPVIVKFTEIIATGFTGLCYPTLRLSAIKLLHQITLIFGHSPNGSRPISFSVSGSTTSPRHTSCSPSFASSLWLFCRNIIRLSYLQPRKVRSPSTFSVDGSVTYCSPESWKTPVYYK